MRATITFGLVAAVALPAAAAEAKGKDGSSGVISGEWGYVEILPEAPPAGTTIQLREGWIRVESAPDDEEPGSGSFGVVTSEAMGLTPTQAPGVRTEPQPGLRAGPGYPQYEEPRRDYRRRRQQQAPTEGGGAPDPGACYEERESYVKELFRIAGIEDVEHPLALIEGLNNTPGLSPWVRFNLFGLPYGGPGPWTGVTWIEPLRPLAWDDGVQYAARELSECMRLQLGFDDRLVDPDIERQEQLEQQGRVEPQRQEPPRRRGTL
ncbi:hypothetical protein [Vulgatibacter sp.]|uniref:hypothetical protein n=1 Tax=Vulgatibacter sp. TaxID=1971226 RepID=UPI003565F677